MRSEAQGAALVTGVLVVGSGYSLGEVFYITFHFVIAHSVYNLILPDEMFPDLRPRPVGGEHGDSPQGLGSGAGVGVCQAARHGCILSLELASCQRGLPNIWAEVARADA